MTAITDGRVPSELTAVAKTKEFVIATTIAPAIRSIDIDTSKLKPITEVEMFGDVTLVDGYALPNFRGCHALISLRDQPRFLAAAQASSPPEHLLLHWRPAAAENAIVHSSIKIERGKHRKTKQIGVPSCWSSNVTGATGSKSPVTCGSWGLPVSAAV